MTDSAQSGARREWLVLAVILVLAVCLRGGFLFERAAAPDFAQPEIDAGFHDDWARSLAFADWRPDDPSKDPRFEGAPYLRPPGYPFFLALIYRASAGSYLAPRIVQALLGVLSVFLVYRIARYCGSVRAAQIASALMALHWLPLYFEGELHAPALLIALELAGTLGVLHYARSARRAALFGAGLAFGCAALVRPNALVFVLIALAWLWVQERRRGRLPAVALGLFALASALPIAPVTLRNLRASGSFVPISSNLGINLYLGNNPNATGLIAGGVEGLGPFRTCYDYPRLVAALEQREGRPFTHAQASSFFVGQALDFISGEPGRFVALSLKKLGYLVGPSEIGHNKEVAQEAEASFVLRLLPGPFPVFLALALLGLLVRTRPAVGTPELSGTVLSASLALGWLASVLFFFAAARYRLPALPFLFVLAGGGVAALLERRFERRALSASGLALFLLLAAWFLPARIEGDRVRWLTDRGRAARANGDVAAALADFDEALALDGNYATAHYEKAITLHGTGGKDAALQHYLQAIRSEPGHGNSRFNLGVLYAERADYEQAIVHFEACLQFNPQMTVVYPNLGNAYLRAGRQADAIAALRRGRESAPQDQRIALLLATTLAQVGEFASAKAVFEGAVSATPGDPALANAFAWLLATAPRAKVRDAQRALELARIAVRATARREWSFLLTLAAAQAESGDFGAATQTAREALDVARNSGMTRPPQILDACLSAFASGRPFRVPAR